MINIFGIIVIIILLISLIYYLHNRSLDSFIVFLDDIVIPKSCYNYLVSNGINYFLFNTNKIVDGITNPIKFNTKKEASNYLANSQCPSNIPFINLAVSKYSDDPTVSFQRECNKKISPNIFELDMCSAYSSASDTLSNNYMSKINKIENDRKQYSNFDLETCMIDKATSEDPGLNDSNFRNYFKKYFNRMNSNIDESYLYITN